MTSWKSGDDMKFSVGDTVVMAYLLLSHECMKSELWLFRLRDLFGKIGTITSIKQYKRRTIYRVYFEGYGAWWIEHDWISLYTAIEVSSKDKRALDSFIEDW